MAANTVIRAVSLSNKHKKIGLFVYQSYKVSGCDFSLKILQSVGLQYFFSRANPGIRLPPDLPFYAEVGLRTTM